jgi:hypothetical protein
MAYSNGRRLSTNDAASFLGLSRRTLEKARVSGDGPLFLKLFDRVLYDTHDLEDWMRKRRRRSTSESKCQ